jgi:nitrite reductase/ring-hydroxylating ferredoxin subunit
MADWMEAAEVSEFEQADRKLVDLGGTLQIGLFKVQEKFYAVSAWCSHERATIVHGDLEGFELTCPLHGARFDIRNGRHLALPAVRPIQSYKVKVTDGKVMVKV